jgi:hypothetical protein
MTNNNTLAACVSCLSHQKSNPDGQVVYMRCEAKNSTLRGAAATPCVALFRHSHVPWAAATAILLILLLFTYRESSIFLIYAHCYY